MRHLTTKTEPAAFLAGYGPTWRTGLLSEHLEAFKAAGGVVRRAASGTGVAWALVDGGAYPVVCSELTVVYTEDGPQSGRCGVPAVRLGCCEPHAVDVEAWQAEHYDAVAEAAWEESRR